VATGGPLLQPLVSIWAACHLFYNPQLLAKHISVRNCLPGAQKTFFAIPIITFQFAPSRHPSHGEEPLLANLYSLSISEKKGFVASLPSRRSREVGDGILHVVVRPYMGE
jgi:hypothetical protein